MRDTVVLDWETSSPPPSPSSKLPPGGGMYRLLQSRSLSGVMTVSILTNIKQQIFVCVGRLEDYYRSHFDISSEPIYLDALVEREEMAKETIVL